MTKELRVGIIGCGTIGTEIAKACAGLLRRNVTLKAVADVDLSKCWALIRQSRARSVAMCSARKLFTVCDLVIEAAGPDAVAEVFRYAIAARKDVMIMSVGGLLGKERLLERARARGIKVYLPSGAISGLDSLKAAARSRITSVAITTSKPPRGLKGAPYLIKNNIKVSQNMKRPKVVFSGTALEAVKAFPKNINVSALLSLAGIGAGRTKVKVVAVPGLTRNCHEVVIQGDFGIIRTVTENVPSPHNPKTSYLAALSAVATLKGIVDPIKIGT